MYRSNYSFIVESAEMQDLESFISGLQAKYEEEYELNSLLEEEQPRFTLIMGGKTND